MVVSELEATFTPAQSARSEPLGRDLSGLPLGDSSAADAADDSAVSEPDYSAGRSSEEEDRADAAPAAPRPRQFLANVLPGEDVHNLVHDTPSVAELSAEQNEYLTLLARILVADDSLLEEATRAFIRRTGLHPDREVLRSWLVARADAVVNAHPAVQVEGGPVYSLVSSKFHLRVDCPTADVTLTPRAAAEQTVLHAARQARYLAEAAGAKASALLRQAEARAAEDASSSSTAKRPTSAPKPSLTPAPFVGPKSKAAYIDEHGRLIRPRGVRGGAKHRRESSTDARTTPDATPAAPSAGGGAQPASTGGISRIGPYPKGLTERQFKEDFAEVIAFVIELTDYNLRRMSVRHPLTQHQMQALVRAATRLRTGEDHDRLFWTLVDVFPPLREFLRKRRVTRQSYEARWLTEPNTGLRVRALFNRSVGRPFRSSSVRDVDEINQRLEQDLLEAQAGKPASAHPAKSAASSWAPTLRAPTDQPSHPAGPPPPPAGRASAARGPSITPAKAAAPGPPPLGRGAPPVPAGVLPPPSYPPPAPKPSSADTAVEPKLAPGELKAQLVERLKTQTAKVLATAAETGLLADTLSKHASPVDQHQHVEIDPTSSGILALSSC